MMNLLKSLTAMSSVTMLSRVLGFVRDTFIARMFGASVMTDAFFIAFKLPNLLRRIFAEGAFYQVFLPMLSEYQCHSNIEETKLFVSRMLGLLIVTLMMIICIGLFSAPWIITVVAPGFENSVEKFSITIEIFKILLPYILLVSLTSMMGAILNAWNFFLIPSFTPIFLNISMISFMVFSGCFWFHLSIIGLAWSVVVGGILQCMYLLPFLKKIDMLVAPKINFFDNKIYKLCQLMAPALVAVSSSQISLVINTIVASFLRDGSISWMYYADRLIELPIGVFGATLSTILLSYLSRFVSAQNDKDYHRLMNWGIKLCFLLSFPSAVIIGILSKPLVITLFQYGKFSEFDVLMTQYSVIAYSIGLPGIILVKVLTSGFYARRDIVTPMKIVIVTIIFSQCINLMCIDLLEHVTFAVSISLGAWLNAGLLYWKLKRKHLFQLKIRWSLFLLQLIIALFIVYVVCLGVLIAVSDWTQSNIAYRVFRMIWILTLCVSSYTITLWCLGIRLKDIVFLKGKDLFLLK